MPMPKASREFLAFLLEGNTPSDSQLTALFKQYAEDQWLDYKSGKLMNKPSEASAVAREYVSAFANAEGGILVVGYDNENTRAIDGATAPGGKTLEGWAASAVSSLPMAAPRFVGVPTERGNVLLIATQRSRTLVPCVEAGESVYYYRFGDTTRAMPQSLVYDLLVGRRAVSELGVSVERADWIRSIHHDVGGNTSQMAIDLRLALENRGLAFGDDVRAGLVTWCLRWPNLEGPASVLLQSIDLVRPLRYVPVGGTSTAPWTLAHIRSRRFHLGSTRDPEISLGPFDVSLTENLNPWPLPIFHDFSSKIGTDTEPEIKLMARGRVRLSAALYAVARGSEPWWHQVTMEYESGVTGLSPDEVRQAIRIGSLYSQRPRVSVEFY